MASLKEKLKGKLNSDLSPKTPDPNAHSINNSALPEAKLCSTCAFRHPSRLKGKVNGAKLGTCQKFNDGSVGYKSKPHDILWGNASCQWYKKEAGK